MRMRIQRHPSWRPYCLCYLVMILVTQATSSSFDARERSASDLQVEVREAQGDWQRLAGPLVGARVVRGVVIPANKAPFTFSVPPDFQPPRVVEVTELRIRYPEGAVSRQDTVYPIVFLLLEHSGGATTVYAMDGSVAVRNAHRGVALLRNDGLSRQRVAATLREVSARLGIAGTLGRVFVGVSTTTGRASEEMYLAELRLVE
jgi:hypothetical protein